MTTKTHYSCAELAEMKLPGFPSSRQSWEDLVKKEQMPFLQVKSKGRNGVRREYLPPKPVLALIRRREAEQQRQALIQAEGALAKKLLAEIQAEKDAQRQKEQDREERARQALDSITTTRNPDLTRAEIDAKVHLVVAYRNWFAVNPGMKRSASFQPFAEAYNAGQIEVSEDVKSVIPKTSWRSIQRWVLNDEKQGGHALMDKRRLPPPTKGVNAITKQPRLRDAIVSLMVEKPHAATSQIRDIIVSLSVDPKTGEILFHVPPLDTFYDFRRDYQAQNAQVLTAVTNPDAWKNKYMSAAGSADYDVLRLNQLWELDATPCDWELVDGRYSMSVIIDVFSRRLCVVVAKTPSSATHKLCLRKAIAKWGLPEKAKTDNGKDYISSAFTLALQALGIAQELCDPFSPWQKPHVERHIQTLLHSMLEFLDSFIGHNVAQRQELRARQSFADQLFKKGETVNVSLTGEELQRLIDAWIDGTYEHDPHKGLGTTPFQKAASWTGPVRRVENDRALDVLLWQPTRSTPYTIQKKGLRLNKVWYNAVAFGGREGEPVRLFQDPSDLGRVVVYDAKMRFLAVAEAHELTGVNPQEVAIHRRKLQAQLINEQKSELKRMAKQTLGSVQSVVTDLLISRAQEAGKLKRLPTSDVAAQSHGLTEASRAADAMDKPPRSPDSEKLVAEAKTLFQVPAKPTEPEEKHPIDINDTADKRYDYWISLKAIEDAGGKVPDDPRHVLFYTEFPKSATFRTQAALRKQKGPSE